MQFVTSPVFDKLCYVNISFCVVIELSQLSNNLIIRSFPSLSQGVLEIGKNPNSKSSRDWKPRLFVLKHYLTSGRSTLEYYKNTRKRWQKQPTKGILSLWPRFEISLAHLCSYKYTLALTTTEAGTIYLAANSAPGMNKWFYYIQTQHIMEPAPGGYSLAYCCMHMTHHTMVFGMQC